MDAKEKKEDKGAGYWSLRERAVIMHRCMFESGLKKKKAFKDLLEVFSKVGTIQNLKVKSNVNKILQSRRDVLIALDGYLGYNVDSAYSLFNLDQLGLKQQSKLIGALMSTSAKQQTHLEEVKIIKSVLMLQMQQDGISIQEIFGSKQKLDRFNKILDDVKPFCLSVINLSQGNLDALGIFSSQAQFRGVSEVYELLSSFQTKEFNPKQRSK